MTTSEPAAQRTVESLEIEIPFNRPHLTGNELGYIKEAADSLILSGNGPFTKRCGAWIRERTGSAAALLTHSATAALEMAVVLADIQPGDEVIMPSFTFVSTANAVVLRGGVPVFVDVRPDTLNLDESLVEAAITPRTKAILPVHYAGIGCDMSRLLDIARGHSLVMIEDAAQGVMSTWEGRPLGAFGALGALSFHETKNVMCGEGGALLVNDPELVDRAEIIFEKGTNRKRFFQGLVDKYSWVDIGSSYALSEINSAFLWAQLEQADPITRDRLRIWETYHQAFEFLEANGLLRRPIVPELAVHNAHMYYVLLPAGGSRATFLTELRNAGVHGVFHFVPLHMSEGGLRHGRAEGELPVTADVSERIVRLPLWVGMSDGEVSRVIDAVCTAAVAQ